MEVLHSRALCVARFDFQRGVGGGGIGRGTGGIRQRSQVRRFSPWIAANAAAPTPSPRPLKRDFFEEDESEDEEGSERDNAGELAWAMRARELAIQDMSFRNFTDEDFQALLPPHLRISKKKKKTKNKQVDREETAMEESQASSSGGGGKNRKNKEDKQHGDGLRQVVDASPVDPKKLKALAKRFNAQRERYMNIEPSFSDSEGDDEEEKFTTELTVVYGGRREAQGGGDESDDDGEDVLPGKDPRMLEIRLNQDLVDSRDVEEVLETVERIKGRFRMSSINVATALHRIAKHMVSMSMSETRRLKYARQSDVSELVALAMELLPECSAQGVSNIAWAISKIGGNLLYRGEMQIVSQAALSKVDEFNPQNIANIAGAFATMQHSSPDLFEKLMNAASKVPREFRAQELAQLLWSFACMARPLDPFLDALDAALEEEQVEQIDPEEVAFPGELSIEQLSSIAWSYAVLGQLHRPFFAHVCKELSAFDRDASVGQHKHMLQLTQIHQVALALKLEGEGLGIALGERLEKLAAGAWERERSSRKSTSFLQKDIERFLVCTGRQWIPEFVDADYSLDFAMKGGRVAIEVNGPSHFARNTGELLGHTVLKHRLLEAAGWKIISASYAEWENLQGESEHVDFIQKLVAPYISVP